MLWRDPQIVLLESFDATFFLPISVTALELSYHAPSVFQRRYANRPIVELEGAAQEELKITELRLAKLFSSEAAAPTTSAEGHISQPDKAAGIDQLYLLTQ
jgi:hypothetical protein